MRKVLIAGATGALGFEVLKILSQRSIPVRALIHRPESKSKVSPYTDDVFVADACKIENLDGMCDGIDIIFSALGKSVSLFKPEPFDYNDTDYACNRNILHIALNEGVSRFVYTSIKGSDVAYNLQIAQAHHRIQNLLEKSSLSYTILKPVGFFSGLNDLIIMGKRGVIPIPGTGKSKTNSIHPADLALVVANNLVEGPRVLEVGGPEIHTRNEIAEMIKEKTGARIIHIPVTLAKAGTFPLSFIRKGMAANLNYFRYISTHDRIAPAYGKITFREYLDHVSLTQLP
jgi:nucleoside-diphosphate-sugar epimerase